MSYKHLIAFIGKKNLPQYKPAGGHDFILVFDKFGNITPEMKQYPHMFDDDDCFLTPKDYASLHGGIGESFFMYLYDSGDRWDSETNGLYYSPSLDISVNCGELDGSEYAVLSKIYEILSQKLPATEEEEKIEFKLEG